MPNTLTALPTSQMPTAFELVSGNELALPEAEAVAAPGAALLKALLWPGDQPARSVVRRAVAGTALAEAKLRSSPAAGRTRRPGGGGTGLCWRRDWRQTKDGIDSRASARGVPLCIKDMSATG